MLDIEGLQDQQVETEAFWRGPRSNHLELKDITVDSILDALSAVCLSSSFIQKSVQSLHNVDM